MLDIPADSTANLKVRQRRVTAFLLIHLLVGSASFVALVAAGPRPLYVIGVVLNAWAVLSFSWTLGRITGALAERRSSARQEFDSVLNLLAS